MPSSTELVVKEPTSQTNEDSEEVDSITQDLDPESKSLYVFKIKPLVYKWIIEELYDYDSTGVPANICKLEEGTEIIIDPQSYPHSILVKKEVGDTLMQLYPNCFYTKKQKQHAGGGQIIVNMDEHIQYKQKLQGLTPKVNDKIKLLINGQHYKILEIYEDKQKVLLEQLNPLLKGSHIVVSLEDIQLL